MEENATMNKEMNKYTTELDSKVNELINHMYSVENWIDNQVNITCNDKQTIQSYLDMFVAELEDFQKGRLEPMY